MGVIINLLEKVNTLVYKKVPYQAYLLLAFFALLAVGQLVYDYNTQPDDLTDWSKIKLAELEPTIELQCPRYDINGVQIVCGGESYLIEEDSYGLV